MDAEPFFMIICLTIIALSMGIAAAHNLFRARAAEQQVKDLRSINDKQSKWLSEARGDILAFKGREIRVVGKSEVDAKFWKEGKLVQGHADKNARQYAIETAGLRSESLAELSYIPPTGDGPGYVEAHITVLRPLAKSTPFEIQNLG